MKELRDVLTTLGDKMTDKEFEEMMTEATITKDGLIPIEGIIHNNIGIKHGFSYINIRQVPWEVLKTEVSRGRC